MSPFKSRLRTVALLIAALAAPAGAVPRLLVVVSVDQMRADYLDRFAGEFQGGFKTLREKGAVFSEARHAHVPTETGPGHAVILTGRFPDQTGIVANNWWDRRASSEVYCVKDSVYGLGPEHLLAYTLGDAMKAKDPASRVVSLSVKDRAAILLGGKKADSAVWYDKNVGEFRTSSYYAKLDWLDAFNARLKEKGHPLAGLSPADWAELIYSTKADRILLDLAEESLRRWKLGADGHPDLLALGFSATDYIGHRYGPDSPQMREHLLKLDGFLQELLKTLDSAVGAGRYDLILTADHGVTPVPESPEGEALGLKRVNLDEFDISLEQGLQNMLPARERWILSSDYPHLYLNRGQADRLRLDWPVFLRKAAKALRKTDGVAQVYVADEIDPRDPYAEVYRRSVMPGRSGDLIVRASSATLVTDRAEGSDHGSPSGDDSHVPLVFLGPDFKGGVYPEPAWVADLAPTVAVVMGADLPPARGARVHAEILRP